MKIGVHSGDFPQRKSLNEILAVIRELGVEYVELPLGHKFVDKENVKEIGLLLAEYHLKPCCIDNWLYFLDPSKVKENQRLIFESIEVAKELKVKFIRIGPFGSIGPQTLKEMIREYKNNIMPCLKKAERERIVLLFENEFGDDPTRKTSQCLEILQSIGSDYFKLLYDPCNFYIAGEEAYPSTYLMLKNFIGYIHLKDAFRVKEWKDDEEQSEERRSKRDECMYVNSENDQVWKDGNSPVDYLCTAVGEGGINYDGLLAALAGDGYDGFASLEPHVKEAIHTETMERTVKYLKARRGVQWER